MCTAASFASRDHYFGRNLDYEISYGEQVAITPRNYPFKFRSAGQIDSHYAIIGVAMIAPNYGVDYPLYYDAINEKGLGIAGLNFVGNAHYFPEAEGKDNIAQFELVPWILGQCANVAEAREKFDKINLLNVGFSDEFPPSDLHWMLYDTTGACIVVESVADGLKIYDNPVGVMTNNPPFDKQLLKLSDFVHCSAAQPANVLAPSVDFNMYSRGMGGIGIPGDLSSSSRFAKVAFTKLNSKVPPVTSSLRSNSSADAPNNADNSASDDDLNSVSQFFHILHSVDQQYGCCDLGNDKYEHTLYTSCCNLEKGYYYYTTYNNHQITLVNMHKEDLDGSELAHYPVVETEQIALQN